MLTITPNSKGDNLDRMLRRYKKKVDRIGMVKEVRRRKVFQKPSVTRRQQILKAVYRDQFKLENT